MQDFGKKFGIQWGKKLGIHGSKNIREKVCLNIHIERISHIGLEDSTYNEHKQN